MDPFTIATTVVKLTATCLATAQTLYAIRQKYHDAPLSIVTICSEATIISASLSHLQTIVCQKQEFVQLLDSRPELAHALDTALIGCMVLFSCLDDEVSEITAKSVQTGVLSWKGKAKLVWNHDKLRELLEGLRGQQTGINLLIQLVQLDSLGEIKQLLTQNRPVWEETIQRTQSLRQAHPQVRLPTSIYSADDRASIYSFDPSIAGDSMVEFGFDDFIVNSKVYRQVLASAKGKAQVLVDDQVIEGDLIDLSDVQTIKGAQVNEITRDLESLIISPREGITMEHPKPLEVDATVEVRQPETVNAAEEQYFSRRPVTTEQSASSLPRYYEVAHDTPPLVRSQDNSNSTKRAQLPLQIPSHVRDRKNNRIGKHLFSHISESLISKDFMSAVAGPVGAATGGESKEVLDSVERPQAKISQLGDYLLDKTLAGSDGRKLKLARSSKGGVQVAIRLYKRDPAMPDLTPMAQVYSEVAILRKLKHPNIIHLHEIVESEKAVGVVLEYAPGGSLFDYVSDHQFLNDYTAKRLFAQIIAGVGYIHKMGVVHRNLKLTQLVLDRNRNIIITGFGLAKTFQADFELCEEIEYGLANKSYARQMELTLATGLRRGDLMSTCCGSPFYAAPEIVVGHSLYTGRKVDIWSCGIILYGMLAGYLPYDDDPANPVGENLALLYKYIVSTPLTFAEYVTPHARDLMRRIIVPDPRKRADLDEITRHSWLATYSHVFGKPPARAAPSQLKPIPPSVMPALRPVKVNDERLFKRRSSFTG